MKSKTVYTNPNSISDIPYSWKIQSIDSLCSKVSSGGTPSRKNLDFYRGGTISWIKTKELHDWYVHESEEKITSEALENSAAKLFPANTVLMAMYGDGKTITTLGILRKESATNQACCALIANPNVCNYLFLFYSLKYHRNEFIHLAIGGAQRNLNLELIKKFAIRVPPLQEQFEIASFLAKIDTEIEFLNNENDILENIVKLTFQSWFVNFDGQTEFIDSELGKIPKGWKSEELQNISKVIDSLHITPNYATHGFPMVRVTDIKSGFIDLKKSFKVTKEVYEKFTKNHKPRKNDIVFSRVGTYGVSSFVNTDQSFCLGQNTVVIHSPISHFIYFALNSKSVKNQIEERVGGSTQKTIRLKDIRELSIIKPKDPKVLIIDFNRISELIFYKIFKNTERVNLLSDLHNNLFPKLLSGEIRFDSN